MKKLSLLLLFGILLWSACKKDKGSDPVDSPSTIEFVLSDASLYHYGVGVAEANGIINSFSGKVRLGGVELDAKLLDGNRIAFGLNETVPTGKQKLVFTVNGDVLSELEVDVMALPVIASPDAVVNEYETNIALFEASSMALYDSTCKRFNVTPNPAYTANLNSLQDSLNYYLNAYQNASAADKEIAAKVMNAQLLDIKGVLSALNQHIFMMSISNRFGKTASPCEDANFNTSQAWMCVLKEFRKEMITLIKECGVSWIIGGAVGGAIGAITSLGIGTGLGAGIGFGIATFLNIKAIFSFLSANLANLVGAFIVTGQNIMNKNELRFELDAYTPMSYEVSRRNMQAADKSGNPSAITEYLATYEELATMIKENIPDKADLVPDLRSLTQTAKPLEDLSYLSFSVKGNSKVQFVGVGGTAESPELKFTSSEPTEQQFTLEVTYNDGVFQATNDFPAKLAAGNTTWFKGTYELIMYPGYDSLCSPNHGNKGNVYFCMYSSGGQDRAVVFVKSILNGIPDGLMERPFNLTDGSLKNAYYYDTEYYFYMSGLESNETSIKTGTSGATSSYSYLKSPGGNGTGCGGSAYQFYYRLKVDATKLGSSAPGELSPNELQAIYAKRQ